MRVLLVDDHPAVRAGLVAVLRGEPGLVPVGSARTAEEAVWAARRTNPDLALVDYHLGGADGLSLCRRLKALEQPPRVVIYSAFADTGLAIPAALAGADGLLDKTAPTEELFRAIRAAGRGQRTVPSVGPAARAATAAKLDAEDIPILSMLMHGTPLAEIADVLQMPESAVEERLTSMLERLRVRPAPSSDR